MCPAKQPAAQVDNKKLANSKFGGNGGICYIKVCIGSIDQRSIPKGESDGDDGAEWPDGRRSKQLRRRVADTAPWGTSGLSSPNKSVALAGGREKDLDSQARPESVEISPVRLPNASGEEFDRSIDCGVAACLWLDWCNEICNAPLLKEIV